MKKLLAIAAALLISGSVMAAGTGGSPLYQNLGVMTKKGSNLNNLITTAAERVSPATRGKITIQNDATTRNLYIGINATPNANSHDFKLYAGQAVCFEVIATDYIVLAAQGNLTSNATYWAY